MVVAALVVHAFTLSTKEEEGGSLISEFEASLI